MSASFQSLLCLDYFVSWQQITFPFSSSDFIYKAMQIIYCRDFGVFYLCLKNADLFTWGDGQSAEISVQFFHLLMVALRWAIWSLLHVCTVQWLVKDLKQVYMEIWGALFSVVPSFQSLWHLWWIPDSFSDSLRQKDNGSLYEFQPPWTTWIEKCPQKKSFLKVSLIQSNCLLWRVESPLSWTPFVCSQVTSNNCFLYWFGVYKYYLW